MPPEKKQTSPEPVKKGKGVEVKTIGKRGKDGGPEILDGRRGNKGTEIVDSRT